MGGGGSVLFVELGITAVFVAAAIVGFRRYPWVVVAGLALHGVMDFVHGRLVANPGVPDWWPGFCGAYDIAAAAWLAWSFARRPRLAG